LADKFRKEPDEIEGSSMQLGGMSPVGAAMDMMGTQKYVHSSQVIKTLEKNNKESSQSDLP